MTTPTPPTLAEIEARHNRNEERLCPPGKCDICDDERPSHLDIAHLLRLVRERDAEELDARKALWVGHGHPVSALYGDDGEMQCGLCGQGAWDYKRAPLATLIIGVLANVTRERDAEIANQRAEWATAMADIVRLREALRQWQLGVGDTEIELALKERDARLAEIARECDQGMRFDIYNGRYERIHALATKEGA